MTRRQALVAGAALAIGASRFALRAQVPDDYDAFGFVRAVSRFDLAALQPHFPGYPVYVALTRLAHLALPSPLDSALLVSAAAAAATAAGLWRLGRALGGDRAGVLAVVLYAGAAMPWVLGGAALSDGTATAFAVLAFAALCAPVRPVLAGLAIALMLGTRASCWPLAASFALVAWPDRARRAQIFAAALVGCVAWAAPLAAIVGARPLVALASAHLQGHFTLWGGSIVTRPHLGARAFAFARDLFFDGLAPTPPMLAALAVIVAGCARRPRPSTARTAAIVVVPYALWAFFAQNTLEQPRHLLPLVVAALLGIALAAASRPYAAVAVSLAVALAGAPLAIAHHRSLPAAAQAAAHVARAYPGGDVAIFGGRSVRFFDELPIVRRERTAVSEIYVDLLRLNALPRAVLVTSEVEGAPTHGAWLAEGATFCRDPRLDRQSPCLTLRQYHLPGVLP
jgi:hypothetical protein